MSYKENNQQPDSEQIARRRLLKAAVYTPPVILGSMIAMPEVAQAVVITLPGGTTYTVSTATSACTPCTKLINGTSTNPTKDSLDCLKNQCTNNCVNCDTFVAAAADYGKTTCAKCEKVLKSGCAADPASLPAACGGCTCTQTGGKWNCV